MLAIDAKRGVEATLERVFKNTGRRLDKLSVMWSGTTAAIVFDKKNDIVSAKVIFPNIDETKEIDRGMFNQLIGYALHELGHAWFTDNDPWDAARESHGAFVSGLINGLEDPRIEKCVINSGYAPNSRSLFEYLANQVLTKSGHAEADDLANIPFLLAIEGRRLNGYSICLPDPIPGSPYEQHLRWALSEAHVATDTARITEIAIELHDRLKQAFEDQRKQPDQGDQQDKQSGQQDGQQSGEQAGQQSGKQSGKQSGNKPGDQQGSQGKQGEQGDQAKRLNNPGKGKGKDKFPDKADREVEPTGHINDQLNESKCDADKYMQRPHVGKPIITTIEFHTEVL